MKPDKCMDCKAWEKYDGIKGDEGFGYCYILNIITNGEQFYCAQATKREDT